MRRKKEWLGLLAAGMMGSVSAFGAMTVEVSESLLSVECDKAGTVIAKVVAPDDTVLVDTQYEGYRFTWSPSGSDGAYRYDVRVVMQPVEAVEGEHVQGAETVSEYAGGSVEVRSGKILVPSMQ